MSDPFSDLPTSSPAGGVQAPVPSPAQDGAEPSGFNPVAMVLQALQRHWFSAGTLGALGLVAGLVIALLKINSYRSYGTMLVEPSSRAALTAESVLDGRIGEASRNANLLAKEMLVITLPEVFEGVVDQLGAQKILTMPDPRRDDGPDTDFIRKTLHDLQAYVHRDALAAQARERVDPADESWELRETALRGLSRSIQILPDNENRTLNVMCEALDPALAQDVVNAYMAAALKEHRVFFSQDRNLDFLDDRVAEVTARRDAAFGALAEFRGRMGVADLDAEKAWLTEQVYELRAGLGASDAQLAGRKKQRSFLEQEVKDTPTTVDVPAPGQQVENPEYRSLVDSQRDYEKDLRVLELSDELDQFKLPKAAKLKQEIEAIKQQIAQVPALIQLSATTLTQANPRFLDLRTRLDEVLVELYGIEESDKLRRQRLGRLEERLGALENASNEYASLLRELRAAQDQLNRFETSREELALREKLDTKDLTNLRILMEASFDPVKSGPQRSKYLVYGLAMGLMAGLGQAFLRVLLDRVLRTQTDAKGAGWRPLLEISMRLLKARKAAKAANAPEAARGDPLAVAQELPVAGEGFRLAAESLWLPLLDSHGPAGAGAPSDSSAIGFCPVDRTSPAAMVALAAGIGLARNASSKVCIVDMTDRLPDLLSEQTAEAAAQPPTPGASPKAGPRWREQGMLELVSGQMDAAAAHQPTGIEGLHLVRRGMAAPRGGVSAAAFQTAVRQLQLVFGHVLVVTPSPTVLRDSVGMLRCLDRSLAVAVLEVSAKGALKGLRQTMDESGIQRLGVVLIKDMPKRAADAAYRP